MQGLDASFTKLSVETAKKLKELGYEVWVQCLWTGTEQPEHRITNLRNALQSGLYITGYISLTNYATGAWHIARGWEGVSQGLLDQLLFVAIDIELDGIANTEIRNAVNELDLYSCGNKPKIIYTSYNAWVSKQGNPKTFTDCLLWNAYWDNNIDVDFPSLPYGGWTIDQVIGEQHSSGTNIFDVYVDINTFNRELLLGEEEDMANKKFQQIRALQYLEAAALNDDMELLVRQLKYFGVVPLNTELLKEHITEKD